MIGSDSDEAFDLPALDEQEALCIKSILSKKLVSRGEIVRAQLPLPAVRAVGLQ